MNQLKDCLKKINRFLDKKVVVVPEPIQEKIDKKVENILNKKFIVIILGVLLTPLAIVIVLLASMHWCFLFGTNYEMYQKKIPISPLVITNSLMALQIEIIFYFLNIPHSFAMGVILAYWITNFGLHIMFLSGSEEKKLDINLEFHLISGLLLPLYIIFLDALVYSPRGLF